MGATAHTIEAIYKLHQAGDLSAAETGYLAILKNHPQHVAALHGMGVLAAQKNQFDQAIHYLEQAVDIHANDPVLFLNLGNARKALGLFSQAAHAFQQALALNPHYELAYNNLGSVYYAQGNLPQAIASYQAAIKEQPDYIDAYYNLALALSKNSKVDAAIQIYQQLLEFDPEHAAAKFQLGCLLLEKENITEAEKQFSQIEKHHPFHAETQINLATCHLKKGALHLAKEHYLKALEITPNDTQILFNLAVINMQQGHVDAAIQHYQQIIQLNPDDFAAHNNLAVAFLGKHVGLALHHFKEAYRIQPDNQAIQYTIAMLEKDQRLNSAPTAYIQTLFDAYADHYEPHLLESLDYQLPAVLYDAACKVAGKGNKALEILDLGCGTGLCGMPFKPWAQTLVGVDLSPNMLKVAEEKNLYDLLVEENFLSYLSKKRAEYELIIAGDALVYLGDLSETFLGVTQALRPGGLFLFNTEITDKSDYWLTQSGRFAHHQGYLEQLATEHGLHIALYQRTLTRLQYNEPVLGHVYVLKKQ